MHLLSMDKFVIAEQTDPFGALTCKYDGPDTAWLQHVVIDNLGVKEWNACELRALQTQI